MSRIQRIADYLAKAVEAAWSDADSFSNQAGLPRGLDVRAPGESDPDLRDYQTVAGMDCDYVRKDVAELAIEAAITNERTRIEKELDANDHHLCTTCLRTAKAVADGAGT